MITQWNLYQADKLWDGHLYGAGGVATGGLLCYAVKLS